MKWFKCCTNKNSPTGPEDFYFPLGLWGFCCFGRRGVTRTPKVILTPRSRRGSLPFTILHTESYLSFLNAFNARSVFTSRAFRSLALASSLIMTLAKYSGSFSAFFTTSCPIVMVHLEMEPGKGLEPLAVRLQI